MCSHCSSRAVKRWPQYAQVMRSRRNSLLLLKAGTTSNRLTFDAPRSATIGCTSISDCPPRAALKPPRSVASGPLDHAASVCRDSTLVVITIDAVKSSRCEAAAKPKSNVLTSGRTQREKSTSAVPTCERPVGHGASLHAAGPRPRTSRAAHTSWRRRCAWTQPKWSGRRDLHSGLGRGVAALCCSSYIRIDCEPANGQYRGIESRQLVKEHRAIDAVSNRGLRWRCSRPMPKRRSRPARRPRASSNRSPRRCKSRPACGAKSSRRGRLATSWRGRSRSCARNPPGGSMRRARTWRRARPRRRLCSWRCRPGAPPTAPAARPCASR